MKKVKLKRMPKSRLYGDGGTAPIFPIAGDPNSMTIKGNTAQMSSPYDNAFRKDFLTYGNAAVQTVGGLVDNLSDSNDGTVSVGGKALSGALRGAGTGASIGAALGPIGSAVGAGIGAIGGGIMQGISASKQNAAVREEKKAEMERKSARDDSYSRAILNVFPTTGVKNASYFAKGGRMKMYAIGGAMGDPGINPNPQALPVEGGEVEKLANGVQQVEGATHEQGGVQIGAETEVEDGEVLQNTQQGVNVFSDRLEFNKGVTYAQQAEKIGKKKGDVELKLAESSDIFDTNSAKREIQKLDMELKQLFASQEMYKQRKGIQNPEGQAAFGDLITSALPYADNIGNAIITAKSPRIPAPVYDVVQPLKTEFNINPQLADAERQQANVQKNLTRNTSNSGLVRTQMLATGAMATEQKNQLYGQKENAETQLINADAMNRQQVNNQNIAKEENYNMLKMSRIDDIHQRLSANLANTAQDAQMQIAEDNLRRKDNLTMEIMKAKYKESGVFDRNLQAVFDAYEADDITYEQFLDGVKEAGSKVKKAFKPKEKNAKTPEEIEGDALGATIGAGINNPAMASKYGFFKPK